MGGLCYGRWVNLNVDIYKHVNLWRDFQTCLFINLVSLCLLSCRTHHIDQTLSRVDHDTDIYKTRRWIPKSLRGARWVSVSGPGVRRPSGGPLKVTMHLLWEISLSIYKFKQQWRRNTVHYEQNENVISILKGKLVINSFFFFTQ